MARSVAARLALASLLLTVAACRSDGPVDDRGGTRAPDRQELVIEAPRTVVTRDGAYELVWFPDGGVVPVNEPFTVDVQVARTDEARTPVVGAEVSMTCFMPDHGHGMLREPRGVEVGGGTYRVEGFLLHMGGYWTVTLSVVDQGLAATADDEITIE